MSKDDYRPLRIIRRAVIMAGTREELARSYPHAEVQRMSQEATAQTATVQGVYEIKRVLNCPTLQERKFLAIKLDGKNPSALEIPQHKDGYDLPNSNLARSRKGSMKGRMAWEVAVAKAKADAERAKSVRDASREEAKRASSPKSKKPKSVSASGNPPEEEGKTASAKKDKPTKRTSTAENNNATGGEQ